jgi:[ribosomal protein S18]-alanine N-acetyltransferase
MISVNIRVRLAVPEDQHQIANLMYFESHVHRHLDWRAPLDWLGSLFYWVLEENGRILAVLACPPSPQGIAWVRLFAHAGKVNLAEAWDMLWLTARSDIASRGGATVAVISMHGWLGAILKECRFTNKQNIVMLELRNRQTVHRAVPAGVRIRDMRQNDLMDVAELDAAAFEPLWQNAEETLAIALPQASVATIMESADGLVGYQITTANPFGAHLARLAVRPDAQNQGYGSSLVADLVERLDQKGAGRLTVNTQSDNHASLALYKKMGFVGSGQKFPVYCYEIPGD